MLHLFAKALTCVLVHAFPLSKSAFAKGICIRMHTHKPVGRRGWLHPSAQPLTPLCKTRRANGGGQGSLSSSDDERETASPASEKKTFLPHGPASSPSLPQHLELWRYLKGKGAIDNRELVQRRPKELWGPQGVGSGA